MKLKFFVIYLLLTISLGGCSVTYNAVAKYSNSDEILVGSVEHNLMQGSASFKLNGLESGLACEGIGERPYYIPSNLVCAGQKGRGFGSCSDGRTVKFDWEAHSCTFSSGVGKDSLENLFYFFAGMGENETKIYIEKIHKGMNPKEARDYILNNQSNEY